MPIPVASGHPQYSGNFIPEIWSSKLLVKFYAATVFGEIANTDYEGEIKQFGDTIQIRTRPDITIRPYQKGQVLDLDRPDSPKVELSIDKAHYFNLLLDAVDKYQTDIDLLNEWADDASEQMKIATDTDILGTIYADAHADNVGATAGAKSGSYDLGAAGASVSLTKANIIDTIVDCGSVLDEQNVPESDRWIIMPAWATGMIKKSDLKDASLAGDNTSIVRNGRIGIIDRFTIYQSNNLESVDDAGTDVWNMIFGQKSALTFAAQFTEMQTVTPESYFGELMRGLEVYGYEVLKPEALGNLYASKG